MDLVFSEVLGIIKGSTSSLTGLRPLTREEYVSRSCRIAPLFTLETERQSVYDVFETYEKMKVGYQDWDAIDRTRHILAQLHDDRSLLIKLRELIDELYVDGRFTIRSLLITGLSVPKLNNP